MLLAVPGFQGSGMLGFSELLGSSVWICRIFDVHGLSTVKLLHGLGRFEHFENVVSCRKSGSSSPTGVAVALFAVAVVFLIVEAGAREGGLGGRVHGA